MSWGLAEFDAERRGYKEGVAVGISQGISQGITQGLQQGISQGAQQKAIETAKNLLSMSISIENIAKATGLSLKEIQDLVK